MYLLEKCVVPSLFARVTLVLVFATLGEAAPLTWYLSGVKMADGAVANGSFTFDASTNAYSAVNITTSGGSVFAGSTYTAVDPSQLGLVDGTNAVLVPNPGLANFTGTPVLVLFFDTTLTNAGGTSGLTGFPSYETTCRNSACTGPGPTSRNFTAGIVTTTPPVSVPALSKFGLAILAVLLMGSSALLLRRRAARSFLKIPKPDYTAVSW